MMTNFIKYTCIRTPMKNSYFLYVNPYLLISFHMMPIYINIGVKCLEQLITYNKFTFKHFTCFKYDTIVYSLFIVICR